MQCAVQGHIGIYASGKCINRKGRRLCICVAILGIYYNILVVVVYIKEAGERAYSIIFLIRATGVRFKISMISKYHVLILRGIYLD